MNRKLINLAGTLVLATYVYGVYESCYHTVSRPCMGEEHKEGSCNGVGTQPKWTYDWFSWPYINFCEPIASGGNTGCVSEDPVQCYCRMTEMDCYGNVRTVNFPPGDVIPHHAGGGCGC